MKKFARLFFCLGLAWKLVLVLTLTAHGQSAPVPTAPPRPSSAVPTVPSLPMDCVGDEERILYSNWGDSTINAVCVNIKDGKTRQVVVVAGVPGVQRILSISNGMDFYAVSYNKAYKYIQYPLDGQQARSWRIPSGGLAFDPDPLISNEFGSWREISLSFRFPWEKEGLRFYPNMSGGSYSDPLKDDPRLGCTQFLTLKTLDYCLDPQTQTVFRPEKTLFGTRWGYGTEFFAGRQPVNMAVNPDGGKLYVSLASQRNELGRIVSLGYAGRAGDTLTEDIMVYNLDVLPDWYQDRIAASQNGLYFISRSGGRDSIWFINAKTGSLMNVLSGMKGETLSGLAVAPPSYGGKG